MNHDSDDWTPARRHPLTGPQLKALLLVASDARLQSADTAHRNAADAGRRLARMTRLHGVPMPDALATAIDARTPVDELMRIKELAKALVSKAGDRESRELAKLLYHAAVAAAFVHHAAFISGRPLGKEARMYDTLATSWAGHPIGDLFREAAARARQL